MLEGLPPNHRLLKALNALDEQKRNGGKKILELTDAVRLKVLMRLYEGYAIEASDLDEEGDSDSVDMYIAISREKVLPLFWDLLSELEGDLVVPTLMRVHNDEWQQFTRDPLDKSVFQSTLRGYTNCLLHDGKSALIVAGEQQNEVMALLQSRMIVVTTDKDRVGAFESVAQRFQLQRDDTLDAIIKHNPTYITTLSRRKQTEDLRRALSLELDEEAPDGTDDEYDEGY